MHELWLANSLNGLMEIIGWRREVRKGRSGGDLEFLTLGTRDKFRNSGSHPGVFLTSAVRSLVPAVTAVRVPIAQLAYVDAHVRLQAAVLVDGTLIHPAVRTWKHTQQRDGEGQISVLWCEDEYHIYVFLKYRQTKVIL